MSSVKSRKCPPVSRCTECSVVALDILEGSVLSCWSLNVPHECEEQMAGVSTKEQFFHRPLFL